MIMITILDTLPQLDSYPERYLELVAAALTVSASLVAAQVHYPGRNDG
ncbi:MAG: hypothetical protein J7455_20615 [Roseiflexus sp.]|jgi:hypothetical protein|nr:hypothetical protein [Roseiflexus sp.]MBO9390292.1 hypothetical protein [Roseiflexus sp.]